MHKFKVTALVGLSLFLSGCKWDQQSGVQGHIVMQDGKPVVGAIVTLKEAGSQIEHSVFSDSQGNYHFPMKEVQGWTLRVAYPGQETQTLTLQKAKDAGDFTLKADPKAWTHSTSDNWLALLPDGQMRRELILNCNTCHGIAGSRAMINGKARTVEDWSAAISMMRAMDVYKVVPPDFDDKAYAKWLADNLSDDKLPQIALPKPIDPALAGRIEITEYPYPNQQDMPHDLVIAPDGHIWVTGFFDGNVIELDPATGKTRSLDVSNGKGGGNVRALKISKDGLLWVVLGETQTLVRLDIKTGKYQTFPIKMYAHDVELDSKGMPWVNDYMGKPERIGSVDPVTGKLTEYYINAPQIPDSQGAPLPYGLQVDKEDILWGSQLAANTLFRFDPKTGKSRVYNMPEYNSGPRRLALGTDGTIWIPEWNTGYLTGFNPRTEKFTRHKMGASTMGLYDVEVDPRTGVVWGTGSLSSSIIRFDPRTGKVDHIPLPTQPAYMRHIAVDPRNGDVWTTYAELPASTPKIVRIRFQDKALKK